MSQPPYDLLKIGELYRQNHMRTLDSIATEGIMPESQVHSVYREDYSANTRRILALRDQHKPIEQSGTISLPGDDLYRQHMRVLPSSSTLERRLMLQPRSDNDDDLYEVSVRILSRTPTTAAIPEACSSSSELCRQKSHQEIAIDQRVRRTKCITRFFKRKVDDLKTVLVRISEGMDENRGKSILI